jgi:predicted DNA-binding transcriptional regulator AlpA
MEAHEAAQLAIATSWEALHRGHGILSISEMSRLSGVSRQDIYRIFNHGAVNGS